MYTICINGAPGSGKTLMSRELLKEENREVVHLDYILERFRRLLPEQSINTITRESEGVYSQINRQSLIYRIIHQKYIYGTYRKIRDAYVMYELKRLKQTAEEAGKEYLIVEGVDADRYIDIFEYDFKIYINSKNEECLSRVESRDAMPGVKFDHHLYCGYDNVDWDFYDIVITNLCFMEEFLITICELENSIRYLNGFKRNLKKRKNN